MAKFHFVEDYERHIKKLVKAHDLDEAMSLAVGGGYERIGHIQADLLLKFGLRNNMILADVGCGSGRTATAVSKVVDINYEGFDVVKRLLDYAATKCPSHYQFILNRDIHLPSTDERYDMVCAFSLFTHLLHEETFVYLGDMFRTLKPGGKVVFSFLEFAMESHWRVFEGTADAMLQSKRPHLNMFIERNVIEVMADKIGFCKPIFIDATTPLSPHGAMGQSLAEITKPV